MCTIYHLWRKYFHWRQTSKVRSSYISFILSFSFRLLQLQPYNEEKCYFRKKFVITCCVLTRLFKKTFYVYNIKSIQYDKYQLYNGNKTFDKVVDHHRRWPMSNNREPSRVKREWYDQHLTSKSHLVISTYRGLLPRRIKVLRQLWKPYNSKDFITEVN